MIIKSNFLIGIIFASLAAVIVLLIFNIFFVTPAFTNFIEKNTETALMRMATQMAAELIPAESEITQASLPRNFPNEVEHVRKMFNLWKVKVYSPSGEILISIPPEEAGYERKREDFFREIIADGKARALLMKNERKDFKDKNGERVIIETYVPIMRGDKIVGIFEIYSDITETKLHLDELRFRSHAMMLVITLFFLLAIAVSVVKANKSITERIKVEEEREKLIQELQDALSEVKKLSGLLPICASCKKIRDDKGYWNQIEEYIRDRSEAEFSHSICPECFKKLYSDLPRKD